MDCSRLMMMVKSDGMSSVEEHRFRLGWERIDQPSRRAKEIERVRFSVNSRSYQTFEGRKRGGF